MRVFITGCGGLIGSAVAELAHAQGHEVSGVDADYRGKWFGPEGSVEWRLKELVALGVTVTRADFREQLHLCAGADLVVHCASQPSHDLSRSRVVEDSAINYLGTVELLSAVARWAPNATFVFLSTNKVYGDSVNQLEYQNQGTRDVPTDPKVAMFGIDEKWPVEPALHTPFGVSKLAADLMVQEFEKTFGLRTVSLRCGCLTGKSGSAVELQGFLGYLVRCAVEGRPYTIYGYGGRQVRDNIDSEDVARAILACVKGPSGVFNMGGGPKNTISVIEAIQYLEAHHGLSMTLKEGPARLGDHRFWVSDCRKFEHAHRGWKRTKSVIDSLDEMVEAGKKHAAA